MFRSSIILVAIARLVGRSTPLAAEDLLAHANELLVVGACAEGSSPRVKPDIVEAHCKDVTATQTEYKKQWITPASQFFRTIVPSGLPKQVVYPFSGGDLSTALTVFPDADEITTLSLEPAGDVRALTRLTEADLKQQLAVVASELKFLYTTNFSKTMNMISAMRGGKLPTQLIFTLSAMHLHGYQPTAVRYFKLDKDGEIVYLTDDDLAKNDKIKHVYSANLGLGDVEIRYKKRGVANAREQVYRHIVADLSDDKLAKWDAPIKHLAKKGDVAAMTKAASYLLSWESFSKIRKYLLDHAVWMVSDTTGVPPVFGQKAGFEYETWGEWAGSNMAAGNGEMRPVWKALFAAQTPKRDMKFRFGYPNNKGDGHLVVMKRKPAQASAERTSK